MIRTVAAVGLVLLATTTLPAEASTVSTNFTGYITELYYFDPGTNSATDVAGIAGVKLNDPFSVGYSYQTDAGTYDTLSGPDGLNGGDYYGSSFSATIGTLGVAFNQPKVKIENFPDSSSFLDSFQVWGSSFFESPTSNIPGYSVDAMFLTQWVLPTILQGPDLPTTAVDPANDILQREFELSLLQAGTGTEFRIVGSLGTAAVTPVPASAPLFLTALGVVGFASWKRRRA